MYDETKEACEAATEALVGQIAKPITLNERIKSEQQQLTQKLADLKKAEQILTNNPEIEELLNILGRSGRRLI